MAGVPVRALAYPRLTGQPEIGDTVLLNTGALDLGLGTGGYALVVALPDRLPPDSRGPGTWSRPGTRRCRRPCSARTSRARRTTRSCARPTAWTASRSWSPTCTRPCPPCWPPILLNGSRAGPAQPGPPTGQCRPARVAYVMLDGGALPIWFSRTVAALREIGWLAGTITVGQAFGGDLEAVTLHSGLLAARHVLGAELVVVAQGPGNLGTGTRWGFSGVAAGEAVNAAAVLGGRPVASLRISEADPRERHRGISHHSLTAYGRVALASGRRGGARPARRVRRRGRRGGRAARRPAQPGQGRRGRPARGTAGCPVPLSTMGRGLDGDLAYFLAAAAAGRHAAALVTGLTG